VNYYSFHIGDYMVHTRHLSLMEDLAYRRLLDLYYTREGEMPDNAARLIGMETEPLAVEIVLAEFFPGGRNKRADDELAKMRAKQANARDSVAKRQEHASVTQASRKRHAHTQTNTNTNTNKEIPETRPRKARATPLPPDFVGSPRVLGWALDKGYPATDVAAQLEAFVSYAKRKGATYVDWDEALMAAIREDWAKVRSKPQDMARTTVPADPSSFNRTREAPMTPEQREAADKARKLAMSALKVVAK
jgi:uncharacterized protein YdaU (DUF1376 family)